MAGSVLLCLYYLKTWWRVGRDPAKGTIIPRFEAPKDLSPAAVRFIRRMGYDRKILPVAVVSMAVKGFLTILESDDGVYNLKRTNAGTDVLSPGERRAANQLFSGDRQQIELKNAQHRRIQAAIKALRTSLSAEYEKTHFLRNVRYFVPGIIITLVILSGVVMSASEWGGVLFMAVWLSGWSVGVYFLALMVVRAWRSRKVGGAVFITLFALPFFAGELFGLVVVALAVPPLGLLLLVFAIGMDIAFYHLLKAPTLAGRRVMDEIDGLEMYLAVAEKDRLNLINPPDRTPEHFEALLPYALALDVENQWSEQFADVLATAAVSGQPSRYHTPHWYSGNTVLSGLAANLGNSFANSVSASSSAPGSSSGSGGGGSSGGGGGGGGGGGW